MKWSLIVLVPLVVAASGCQRPQGDLDPDERRKPVRVETVARADLEMSIPCAGDVVARHSVRMLARVAGTIELGDVSPGRRVERGEVVARVRSRQLELELEAAKIQLASVTRRRDLLKRQVAAGLAPGLELEDAGAQVQAAEVQMRLARDALAEGEVRAAIAGVVGARAALVDGEWVAIGAEIATVTDPTDLLVDARVAAADVAAVVAGLEVTFAGVDAAGVVEEVDSSLDPRTRTAAIRIALAPGADVKPGGFLAGRVTVGRIANAVSVPRAAIVDRAGSRALFVVRERVGGSYVERIGVTVGREIGDRTEVTNGLAEGAVVVIDGVGDLSSDEAVVVVP